MKPLGELTLALYALTAPPPHGGKRPLQHWAETVAHELFRHTEAIVQALDWPCLLPHARRHPHAALGLLFYPVLGRICGRRPAHEASLTDCIAPPLTTVQQTTFDRHSDYLLLHDILYETDGREVVATRLSQLLHTAPAIGTQLPLSTLYELTHLIFYATLFGRRPLLISSQSRDWLHANLDSLLWLHLDRGNLDIVAELVLSGRYARCISESTDDLASWTIARWAVENDCLSCNRDPLPAYPFEDSYHLRLVTLMALGDRS